MTSSYHHKSNGQVEACIKFVKYMIKKCRETDDDVHFALLQVRLTPIGAGLTSQATLLFSRPISALLPHKLAESQ